MFLLDTDVCIAFLGGDRSVSTRLLQLTPDQVELCSVVKAELLFGARQSERVSANLERLARFFEAFESLPFDDEAADWYGTLRAATNRAGTPVGGNDLMIASIAMARQRTLVTRNEREFRQVPGLSVEVW